MAGAWEFDLSGGHPALDFVKTLDNRFGSDGPVELLNSYGDLLGFVRQWDLLSTRQTKLLLDEVGNGAAERVLRSARELREALASAIYSAVDGASPPPAVLRTLERHFRLARRHQVLAWTEPEIESEWSKFEWSWEVSAREAGLPVWMLAVAASELMTSDAMDRVRTCDSETCRWLFLDTSKNHTRRWCNMKVCGNRVKARRFQARRQEQDMAD